MHSEVNHSSPREPCGAWASALVIQETGSTHQVSNAADEPKREQAASPPLADRTERLYVKCWHPQNRPEKVKMV